MMENTLVFTADTFTTQLFRGGSVAVNDEKPDTEKERRRVLGKLNGNEGADVASGG